jgi:hypothetical protein
MNRWAIDRAKGAGTFLEGWSAGIAEMKRDLPAIGELGADLAVTFRDGVAGSLSAAVFEAEKLEDGLLNVSRMMGQMALEFGVRNLMTAGLGALFPAPVAHGGGVVGKTAFPKRMVPPALFAGAPRLHNGLRSNEFPAIVERGEEIRSKRQVAASKMSGGQMESLLGQILGVLQQRQILNATIVDSRDVVTLQQMEGREGEKLVMGHVGRN